MSSNTASPVLLAKSARTMVSFSVRRCVVWRERIVERPPRSQPRQVARRREPEPSRVSRPRPEARRPSPRSMTEMEQAQARNRMLATAVGLHLRAAFLRDGHRARTRRYGSSRLCIPLQPLQVGSHVGGVLIAQIAIFLQRLVDDVVPVRRAHRDSAAPQPPEHGSEWLRRSRAELSPRNGNAPSPSRTAPHRTKTDRCGHPVPSPAPAPATCRPPCPAWCRDWSDAPRPSNPSAC